jgi:hypothetical protein
LGKSRDLSTLAVLLRTSSASYLAVSPTLYETVIVTRKNARSIYLGLSEGPARIRRVRIVKGIDWDEFKHVDHKRDYEKAREYWAKGNRRKRKLYNVWPDIDINSDDSLSGIDDNPDDVDSRMTPYPNEASSSRKSRLLGMIQHLHFEELPSTTICLNLARLRNKAKAPAMPALQTLSMRPKAIWQMIDWLDRHQELTMHPFHTYVNSLPAQRICVQLPVIDHHLEKSYMSSRIVSVEEQLSRDDRQDQHTYLRQCLQNLVGGPHAAPMRLAGLTGQIYGEHLTIHNTTAHLPRLFNRKSCRLFFRPCICLDGHISDEIDDHYCYNHYANDVGSRIRSDGLPEPGLRARPTTLESLEIYDLDWQSGTMYGGLKDSRMIEGLQTEIGRKPDEEREFLSRVVTMKSSNDVKPCVCCGERQLSYEQVSWTPRESTLTASEFHQVDYHVLGEFMNWSLVALQRRSGFGTDSLIPFQGAHNASFHPSDGQRIRADQEGNPYSKLT